MEKLKRWYEYYEEKYQPFELSLLYLRAETVRSVVSVLIFLKNENKFVYVSLLFYFSVQQKNMNHRNVFVKYNSTYW